MFGVKLRIDNTQELREGFQQKPVWSGLTQSLQIPGQEETFKQILITYVQGTNVEMCLGWHGRTEKGLNQAQGAQEHIWRKQFPSLTTG